MSEQEIITRDAELLRNPDVVREGRDEEIKENKDRNDRGLAPMTIGQKLMFRDNWRKTKLSDIHRNLGLMDTTKDGYVGLRQDGPGGAGPKYRKSRKSQRKSRKSQRKHRKSRKLQRKSQKHTKTKRKHRRKGKK